MKNNVNLNECYNSGVKPEIAYEYEFYINKEIYKTRKQVITGQELHEMIGTNPQTHFIRMKLPDGKKLVGSKVEVNLTECGIERFIILSYDQEIIDIHDCYCKGVNPVITYKYLIKINKDKYEVEQETITGKEIIVLAGESPDKNGVRMFTKSGKKMLGLDESVDLTKSGVERFVIVPLDCTEGFAIAEPFKQFTAEDISYIKSYTTQVDFIEKGQTCWVVFRQFKLPDGYNVAEADMAILIPKNYPLGRLDMFYFNPALSRKDAKPIGALTSTTLEGKNYQRWSRHRTVANKWDPEVDNLESQVMLAKSCLESEFKKR
ncbi:multiubiquitin domain-containing protein [Salegentibacter sp. JZCK2]|uniref:multiubiquitin domain-containing protein n=1 Tax=Salegentibacter tibetensis TaxID=2873600 RepID=UPI001CC94BA0|nr:multiubiquitin domain-containing protein [Salegentibacter tibetensis]MBZ9731184.1 multiubiquitin domain-containing protein [Salegentibacter tibetensis]